MQMAFARETQKMTDMLKVMMVEKRNAHESPLYSALWYRQTHPKKSSNKEHQTKEPRERGTTMSTKGHRGWLRSNFSPDTTIDPKHMK